MDLTNLNKDRKIRRKPAIDLTTMVYGKLPPQAKDLEEAVLGAIMLEKSAFDTVSDMLRPETFYVHAHELIYRAFQRLAQKSQPIDILTVTEELKRSEELEAVGGPYYVTKLTGMVTSTANLENHARLLTQKWIGRQLIALSGETISQAYEDSSDVFEILEDHEKRLTEITLSTGASTYSSLDSELVKAVRRIEDLRKLDSHLTGVTSGFKGVDQVTHGWQKTDLIILAARPSVGKTALALNFARSAGVPVGFFSMEMNTGQLINRLLAADTGLHLEKISNGRLDDDGMKQLYSQGIQRLAKVQIFFDDTAALSGWELRSRARKMIRKHGIGLLIVDYLQLMSGEAGKYQNREQVVSANAQGLKSLAKELKIPVIALSQLSREPEKRRGADKTPWLADLRESGAIEQDADLVAFLYRPEYYDQPGSIDKGDTSGETMVTIAKHRNGRTIRPSEAIRLRAHLATQKFYDWDDTGVKQGNLLTPAPGWQPIDYTQSLRENKSDDLPF